MKTLLISGLINYKNLRDGICTRRFISFAIAIVLTLGVFSNVYAQENRKDTITILTFNDFHGAFLPDGDTPGAARFVSEFLALKARVPNPVVVSGGDNFSGSFFSLMSKGEPHELFTKIAGDQIRIISAVGNHEFDWGSDYLLENSCENINYVGQNLNSKNDPVNFKRLIPDYRVITVELPGNKKTRIGIVGISTPTTPTSGKKPYVDEYNFYPVHHSLITRSALDCKADIVILLMHIGTCMEGDVPVVHPGDIESEEEIKKLEFIDGIVSAHSHDLVSGDFITAEGRNVPMIQAGSNGTHIGLIQYELDGDNVRCIKNELVKVNPNAVPDPIIERLVNDIIDKYGFNKEIASISKDMSHSRDRDLHKFTEVGAIVTASYLNEISGYREVGDKPVIAVHHFKGIRTGLIKGSLKKAIAGNVLPFGGNLGVYRMTGAQIRDLFTQGLTQDPRGRLQTCNMMFRTNRGRITSMYLWHKDTSCYIEITDDMECILMCDDYIAYGGDNYDLELLGREVEWFDKTVTTDCFLNFIESKGVFPNDEYRIAESTELNRRYNKMNRTDRQGRRQTVDMRYGAGAAL